MGEDCKKVFEVFLRYAFLFVILLFGFKIFYSLFFYLTFFSSNFLFRQLFNTVLVGNTIFLESLVPIEITGPCVGGAAYSLLLILNLATPGVGLLKRIFSLLFSFLVFLLVNVLRIFALGVLFYYNSPLFDPLHKLFWYFGSTVFVVLIWFLEVRIFDIEEVPFYSDLKFFYLHSTLRRSSMRGRKRGRKR